MLWLAAVLDRANARLNDRQMATGRNHVMRRDLSEEWVCLIWEHSIMPSVAELLYGEEERLREFELERLRGTPTVAAADELPETEGNHEDAAAHRARAVPGRVAQPS